jgi:hypothetical protein
MTSEKIAEELLFPIWQCIDADFKKKYKADAWGYFENFLRSAACAEDLSQFFDKFKRLLPIDWKHQFEKPVLGVIQSGKDYEVLQALRTECGTLILLTRVLNNERKEIANEKYANLNP